MVVNIEREASLQREKFQITREKRPMVSGLRCAKFPRAKRTESTSDRPPRYGLLLRSDRGAGSAFAAGQTCRRGRRTRETGRFDHLQLRGAQIRCPLSDAHVYGAATLPELDCAADAVRCLPARSGAHPRNSF